jgi:uncharacterized damage-inducible protein DinB
MTTSSLSAEELMAWNDKTTRQWCSFVAANEGALDIPCDIYHPGTVGQLLQHIVAAELRYAERLADLPVSDYASLPYRTADDILATHDRALRILRTLLADSSYDWASPIEFTTRTVPRSASWHSPLCAVGTAGAAGRLSDQPAF